MIQIRKEIPADAERLDELLTDAFAFDAYSHQSEALIVRTLRDSGDLMLSLVAENEEGDLVGQIAFSPVQITDGTSGWVGLGPLSVHPRHQRLGYGRQLMEAGLQQIQELGLHGCVVLGDPGFYPLFGFAEQPGLTLDGAQPGCFMARCFRGSMPTGGVAYAPAFDL